MSSAVYARASIKFEDVTKPLIDACSELAGLSERIVALVSRLQKVQRRFANEVDADSKAELDTIIDAVRIMSRIDEPLQ